MLHLYSHCILIYVIFVVKQ